jgi:hypothetical protein
MIMWHAASLCIAKFITSPALSLHCAMACKPGGFAVSSMRSPSYINIATATTTFTAADIMIASGDPIAFRA